MYISTQVSERNVVAQGLAVSSSIGATFIEELQAFYQPLIPFFLLVLVAIIMDTKFGIEKVKARGEQIRMSRALRRCGNKFVDYFCWATLAGLIGSYFGTLFGIPLVAAIILLGVLILELTSVSNNYLEARGYDFRLNWFKWFARKKGFADAIEEAKEDVKETNKRPKSRKKDLGKS